ncbi:MAG TPA: ABC transporter ATP-binding protein [Aquaticitalea sp.]|nr:ABC transporter ATP-binding protein [Aquaticitalea sp.]
MTKTNNHSTLKTENLSIGYVAKKQKKVIATGISFELQKGQLVGLVGENGIGKSTLLRTLTKVQKPLQGDVYINEKNINALTQLELAKTLSLVLTEPVASKNLSVWELVALGRQPYTNWVGALTPEDIKHIEKAMELTDIKDLKNKKCYELSDGQLQKVMIARALAQDTDIIILDEPTSHLDLHHKAYILKLLQKLAVNTQKTVLFSSHEIDLAIQLCDKLLVMTPESVIIDTPSELIAKGVFNRLFPENLIEFDGKTHRFKIKN